MRKHIKRNIVESAYQDNLRRFVEREIIYCATSLVAKLAAAKDVDEELYDILVCPDPENPEENIEALEHWIVTPGLSDELAKRGEMVLQDYLGLCIWGRTCSGQAIFLDGVIQDIYDSLGE
jgi:hypothetical protein